MKLDDDDQLRYRQKHENWPKGSQDSGKNKGCLYWRIYSNNCLHIGGATQQTTAPAAAPAAGAAFSLTGNAAPAAATTSSAPAAGFSFGGTAAPAGKLFLQSNHSI